jgi:putative ABC transport system ATP-binding protein
MIELRDVTKIYQQGRRAVPVLRGVSMRVELGEFVAVMGPSGSGKSTLLHLMGALDVPTSGSIQIGGRELGQLSDRDRSFLRRNRIGFVFQFFNLLPTMTAAENVALPLLLAGENRTSARRRALSALEQMNLSSRAEHLPEELSGGEMQRVAVARAIIAEPELVLCDEPTGNLDSASSAEVLSLLHRLPERGRRAVVMVTHDREAGSSADRVISIRDGQIETPELTREGHAAALSNA